MFKLQGGMNVPPTIMTTAYEYGEKAGAISGGLLFGLILLFGIIRCFQIMRRPTTHKVCVTALLLILVGWGVSIIGGVVKVFTDAPLARGVTMVSSAVTVLFMIGALILGIVGLATYDSERYRQGRAQGIWALIISGVMVIVFLVAFATGLSRRYADDLRGEMASSRSTGPAGFVKREEKNFSLEPGGRWREIPDATRLNPAACLAMRMTGEELFMVVIAEQTGLGVNLPALVEAVKLNMDSGAKVKSQEEETIEINGMNFVRMRTRAYAQEVRMDLFYEQWMATKGGYCWQIVVWGREGHQPRVSQEALNLVRSFRMLRETTLAGNPVQHRVRPAWGYSARLEASEWNAWDNPVDHTALADFSAQRQFEAVMVVPFRYEPGSVDLESATSALLGTMGFEHPAPDSEVGAAEKIWKPSEGGERASGLELERQRKGEDGLIYHYQIRIGHWPAGAVMVAGWYVENQGNAALVNKALAEVTLTEPTGAAPAVPTHAMEEYGRICNDVGLACFGREDYPAAVQWFKRAFEQTRNDPVMLENVAHALEAGGDIPAAVEYLAPYENQFTGHLPLEVRRARLSVFSGDVEAGQRRFVALLDKGLKNEDDLLGWMSLLVDHEAYDPAIRAGEAWLARRPSYNVRRWLAQTVFTSGDQEKGLGLFQKLADDNPRDRRALYDLGEYANEAGKHDRAAEVARQVLADDPESTRALLVLGWSQMGLKWYKDAKATFEQAAKKNPRDDSVQEAIRTASAALGQGNNSDIKEPIAPVVTPLEVAAALAAVQVSEDLEEGHPSVSLARTTGYFYEKGKPARRTLFRRIKVLTAEGAKELSSIEISFNPLVERIYMNRLEVKDGAGTVLGRASVDDAYVRDLNDGTATTEQVLHMQVEGVKPGTIVECEVTLQDRFTADHFEFNRHLFTAFTPVAVEGVFVTGEVGAVKHQLGQGQGVTMMEKPGLKAWIVPSQPPATAESLAIWAERRLPTLWLGGDEGTWEQVGRDYLKDIADRLEPEKEVKELAASLTAGRSSVAEKVAVLARHVQKELSYKAIEFGVRARRPNAGVETLRLRYGDCKDHALLLHQLLKSAGVTSHLAVVNTNWETEARLPSLDQFNHMVVHVPALGDGWLIDPTDKHLALDRFPSEIVAHAGALTLDPARPRLLPKAGRMPEGTCRLRNNRQVTVQGRDWVVEDVLELDGYYASWMRAAFAGLNPSDQRDKIQAVLSAQGPAQVESFRFEALDELQSPARLVTTYRLRDAIRGEGKSRQASLPALWEKDYLGTRYVKERKTDFEFLYPLTFSSRVVVQLPGAATGKVEALKQQGATPFCNWTLAPALMKSEPHRLEVAFDFTAAVGSHPAAQYEAFHNAWEAARRSWERQITWVEP